MWFSIGFSTAIAVITLMIFIFLFLFSSWVTTSPLKFWLFFIPLSVLFNGLSASMMVWANRHQQYKILASNRVIQAVLTVTIQIGFGLAFNNEAGLVIGLLMGQLTSAFLLWFRFRKKGKASLNKPEIKTFKRIAIQHHKLLFYSTPSEFINNLINQTPIFLLQSLGTAYVKAIILPSGYSGCRNFFSPRL